MTGDRVSPVASMDLTGEPVLDFVNTGSRLLARHADSEAAEAAGYGPFGERLGSYADLAAWAERTGVVEPATARALKRHVSKDARRAAAVLRRAIALREALYRIFTAGEAGVVAAPEDLATLQSEARDAGHHRELVQTPDGYVLSWPRTVDPARVIWPVATDALDLLLSDELPRIKRCASDDCNWLFRDASKNRSRRWCEMSACGNRAKARRYQARHR
jgi:predicted RNA-binding Zn ribbon-like protein